MRSFTIVSFDTEDLDIPHLALKESLLMLNSNYSSNLEMPFAPLSLNDEWWHTLAPRSSKGQGVGFYWASPKDGNLTERCLDGTYEYVAIACLNFKGNQTSIPPYCTSLGPDIDICKGLGIKLFLSLGGRPLLSPDDAPIVAAYICDEFLNDGSGPGPLGATVNGTDFHFRSGSNNSLDVLAQALRDNCALDKKVYLSAAPLCRIPDYYLDAAINTGVFDYVWVQFFGDPSCEYSPGNPFNLIVSWLKWYYYLRNYNTTLFLGLTGDSAAEGYIPCDPQLLEVLFFVVWFPKFGGIMVLEGKYECLFSSEKIRPYFNSDVLAYGKKSMNKFPAI
ncbi:acidic endochitinase-like [Coffea arabica]|uniref:Acidic endochitinase-like n=1 Tax=Coffea arabica TaxID=13443 RepID=A0A6P6S762_COFAR|nr:acidic endochitinase-like [Coffea arabica]